MITIENQMQTQTTKKTKKSFEDKFKEEITVFNSE